MVNGVGSGEGLIERVEDPHLDGEGVAQGSPDKRCLLQLSELSRCFKLGRRENATLSENIREAWDGEPIHVPNRKSNGTALATSGYSISVYGDITPGALHKTLATGTEGFDGNADRYLSAQLRGDTPDKPHGGNPKGVLKPFLGRLAAALAFAKQAGEVKRDAEADALWEQVYRDLRHSGRTVPHTGRAKGYAFRLSMLYALADGSKVIRREHLQAALALWSYCRESARLIFGGTQAAEPEPLYLRLMNAILKAPGVSRSGLREVAGHKTPAPAIEDALARLEGSGLAFRRTVQPTGGGRPAECWYPGGGGEGDGDEVDNPSLSEMFSETGREQTNSENYATGLAAEAQAGVSSLPPPPPDEKRMGDGVVNLKPSPPSDVQIADLHHPPSAPLSDGAHAEPLRAERGLL